MSFSQDFLWGAASAAYQIEGAYNEDGKGPGIWDVMSDGHIAHGDDGRVACDHYHRFREDVALMKRIGLKAYRFSVSWPRVMPEEGRVNRPTREYWISPTCWTPRRAATVSSVLKKVIFTLKTAGGPASWASTSPPVPIRQPTRMRKSSRRASRAWA